MQVDDDPVSRQLRELQERVSTLELAVKSSRIGLHNEETYAREKEWFDEVLQGDSYKRRATVMAMPSYKQPATAVWASWMALMTPANHDVHRVYVSDFEVGDAYEHVVAHIMQDPDISKFTALLTLEADNVIPPMAVFQMYHDMEEADVDVLGAMYWVKGEGGAPMAYGRFGDTPFNFRPFVPPPNSVTRVNGCGMGCTLFKLDVFKKVSRPWFRTFQQWTPRVGRESLATQDLFFARKAAAEAGIKFAVTTRVLVGHLDEKTGIIW